MNREIVIVRAPAKLNFFLEIVGKNDEGYHLLQSIMQMVELSDIVIVKQSKQQGIKVSCSIEDLPAGESNIAYKSAVKFFERTGIKPTGLDINLDKEIPASAGMGGGSSNAAAVLVALNKLYDTKLTLEQLCEIGVEIGADVPFCLTGGAAFVQGIGEKITPINTLVDCYIVIAKPEAGVSTPQAFKEYSEKKSGLQQMGIKTILSAWREDNLEKISENLYNVFEQVVSIDGVQRIKEKMLQNGALGAVMSGSGSAVVGIYNKLENAQNAKKELGKKYKDVFLTKPYNDGPTLIM